eukprot:gene9408-10391_t
MLARIIIEQKIKELELAITHQEELLNSQKEMLRGLKDLIAAEISKPDNVFEPKPTTQIDHSHIQLNPAVNQRGSENGKSASLAAAVMAVKKRNRDSLTKDSLPAVDDSTPAKMVRSQPQAAVAPTPSALSTIYNTRRRRAIEKVNQFCSILGPLFPPRGVIVPRSTRPSLVTLGSGDLHEVNYDNDEAVVAVPSKPQSTSSSATSGKVQPAARSAGNATNPSPADGNANGSLKSNVSSAPKVIPPPPVPPSIPPPVMSPAPVNPPLPMVTAKGKASVPQLLASCNACSTFPSRLEALKQLHTMLTVNPQDCRAFLLAGGKEVVHIWLEALEDEKTTDKSSMSMYLEYSLRLLTQVEWTVEAVNSTRIDRLLRKLFKKFTAMDILSSSLSDLLRESWGKYRVIYQHHKVAEERAEQALSGANHAGSAGSLATSTSSTKVPIKIEKGVIDLL